MQPRISIIGSTCAGKTTLACRLSNILGIPHIELDAVYWMPNWQPIQEDIFREKADKLAAQPSWVMDGNYGAVRDIIWKRATTVIWLNYPFYFVFWRLLKRTIKRIITKEELFSGNKETFFACFLSKDSLFIWFLKTHFKYARKFPKVFKEDRFSHLTIITLKNQKEANEFLAECAAQLPAAPGEDRTTALCPRFASAGSSTRIVGKKSKTGETAF